MGIPAGTIKIFAMSIAGNASYPTTTNNCINFDLSKCNAAWWSAVTALGDIVTYDPVADLVLPRYICPLTSTVTKTGWGTFDSSMTPAGKTILLCVVPGAGVVNNVTAHTNSGCYTSYGYDVASGNIPDKTGAYTGSAGNLSYGETGVICKSASFNGNNSQVSMGIIPQLDSAAAHTFQFLFSQRDLSQTDILMRLGGSSSYVMVYTNSGNFIFLVQTSGTGASGRFVSSTQLTANQLELMTLVFKGNGADNAAKMQIYVGASSTPVPLTFTGTLPATLPILNDSGVRAIGYNSSSLDGLIDESKFYSRGLSAQEHFFMRKNLLDHTNFATYTSYTLSTKSNRFRFGQGEGF
jgi:hypothetical protein